MKDWFGPGKVAPSRIDAIILTLNTPPGHMGGVLSFKNLWSVVQEKVQPDFAGASDVAASGGRQRAKKVLEYFNVRRHV